MDQDSGVEGRLLGLPSSAFRLDGKAALITGASRNIGASIAFAFAQSGADVAVVARGRNRLTAMAELITRECPGRKIVPIQGDVADGDDTARVVDEAFHEFQHIDILVNNAHAHGDTMSTPVLEIPDEAMDATYRTNVLGPFRLTRALGRQMIDSGRGGCVINVLSGAGFLPVGHALPYGTSKAALWMMTRYLARELAPLVRVNALVPGVVTEDGQPRNEGQRAVLESSVPFGRMGRPDEISGAAVYLASPAASYTSGTVLFCNGARSW